MAVDILNRKRTGVMTLIKSISGIRGTIGGNPGEALTPLDIVKFTYAYCEKMKERLPKAEGERYKVVVGCQTLRRYGGAACLRNIGLVRR